MMRFSVSGLLAMAALVASLGCDFAGAYGRCLASGRCATSPDAGGPALVRLSPSIGTLTPDFAPATSSYSLTLPRGVTSLTLSAEAGAGVSAIELEGQPLASGATSAPLSIGLSPRVLAVAVHDAEGHSATYSIDVRRSATMLKAGNTGAGDRFGEAVALSSDGSTLAVSADGESSGVLGASADDSAPGAGAVYVFAHSGAGWAQTAYLKASNPGAGDRFGTSVALSANGTTLAVGAWSEASASGGINGDQSDNSSPNSGAVYVFTFDGTTWTQQAYVKASTPGVNAYFGVDVALSGDGSTLAVGSFQESTTALGSGAVYIFRRAGVTWTQTAMLKAEHPGEYDHLGYSIGLSSDGATLVAGADNEDSSASGVGGDQTNDALSNAGAAYVFTLGSTGWSQSAYLKASNPGLEDFFATSVTISRDGSTIVVGTCREDSNATGVNGDQTNDGAKDSGAVYVFVRSGTSWVQQAYLKAAHGDALDLFGRTVSLSADGSTLAVGAPQESSRATGINGDQTDNQAAQAGAVYLFGRVGGTWAQTAYLKMPRPPDAVDALGSGLALSADGQWLATGAVREDSCSTGVVDAEAGNGCLEAGAVFIY